ncbi:TIGR04222 domain-containing membrane protein [Lentzea sp.]|uniref:TIGR04222 domain-containing membrane protein n=1 Tax=Lentzea sp. TaxID=56099 RepID=UPI002B83E3DD|nr:TIGR04222 domain-containing membrane protein [Lentzea sp.]HUQ54141.1 TIGR04222 domain-containing membrane protein [Lentzea sp.]
MAKSSAPHQVVWTAEEIGFLARGPGRAVEAALARMMDGGLVRISREGLVTAVHHTDYGATTPLEAYILSGLLGAARPLQQLVQVSAASHEMGALHQSLITRGMVRPQWGKPRGAIPALRVLLVILAFVSLVGVIAFDGRIILLTALLLFLVFLLRVKGRLTPQGKSVLLYAFRNQRGGAHVVALNGLNRGRNRQGKSTSNSGSSCTTTYDYYDHHNGCGSSSSCSSSSCGSSSSCSSSSSSCSSSSSSCSSSSSSCGSSSSSG